MKKKEKPNTNLPKSSTVKMKVAECRIRDVGKKRAIMDSYTMTKLGIQDGDVIEIAGKKIAAVSAYSFEDKNKKNSYIHIDGQTRQNAGVSLNDYVIVKKSDPKAA